jgi:hypothetical protein
MKIRNVEIKVERKIYFGKQLKQMNLRNEEKP